MDSNLNRGQQGAEPKDLQKWLDAKLKVDSINEINKYSDLSDDWEFLQNQAFEFIHFFDE